MFKKIALSTVAATVTAILAAPAGANIGTSRSDSAQAAALLTAADSADAFASDKPEALRPLYRSLFNDGTRNATLNDMRLGVAAMEIGDYARAEQSFDAALEQIETIYANNERAKQARSKFSKEAVKDFKGEPYERAMAYYYRGLLFLRAGDYENARASFLQGEYQTTVGEKEEYASSFPMLDYLAGWSSQCAGDTSRAQELYAVAQKSMPSLRAPSAGDNVLVVGELGSAPIKSAAGKHHELLQFEKANGDSETGVQFQLVADAANTALAAFEAGSVSYEATNRGGRAIQSILDGKAQFKSVTGAIGDAGAVIGTGVAEVGLLQNDSDMATVGLAVGLAGALFRAMADAAKPDADTRAWDNLPDSVHFSTVQRPAGAWQVSATYTGIEKHATASALDAASGKCSLVWMRSKSALAVGEAAPGTQLSAKEVKKLQKKYADTDKAFRTALVTRN